MSDLDEFTGFSDVAGALDATIAEQTDAIKQIFGAAAGATFTGSQADVAVASGELRGSGVINSVDNGDNFYIDVTYGDGSATATTYNYPDSFSTTQFSTGGLPGDGYAWFVELGHLTRGGTLVAPQPYLGPNFDLNANNLMSDLNKVYV